MVHWSLVRTTQMRHYFCVIFCEFYDFSEFCYQIETKINLSLLEVKMDELEEKTKIGMKNSNSALWQDNDQRVGRVEMVQKQVQNQLESLLNKRSADQNVLSTLATEVMKTAQKSSFVIFAIITKKEN